MGSVITGVRRLPFNSNLTRPTDRHLHLRRFVWRVAVTALIVLAACQTALPLSGNLPIQLPSFITAGQALTVTVGPVNVVDGTAIGLVMVGNLGPRLYRATFMSGTAKFDIPGEHTVQSGYLAFVAASDQARGEGGVVLTSGNRTRVHRSADRD